MNGVRVEGALLYHGKAYLGLHAGFRCYRGSVLEAIDLDKELVQQIRTVA